MRIRLPRVALLAALGLSPYIANAAEEDSREALSGENVRIIEGEERTVYEYRHNGILRAIRIVPRLGRPYFLVSADPSQDLGDLERAKRLVPSWRLLEF